jgi:hypothetical protein
LNYLDLRVFCLQLIKRHVIPPTSEDLGALGGKSTSWNVPCGIIAKTFGSDLVPMHGTRPRCSSMPAASVRQLPGRH